MLRNLKYSIALSLAFLLASLPVHATTGAPSKDRSATPSRAAGAGPGTSDALPPEAAYQFALARLASYEGSFRQALAAFAEAVRLAPGEAYIRLEYARLLARLGRFAPSPQDRSRRLALADTQVREATRLAPDRPDLLREAAQLHYLYLSEGSPANLEAAREAYEAVLESTPEDPQILLPLGEIHLRSGRPEAAATALRKAVRNAPGSGTAVSLLQEALRTLADQRLAEGRSLQAAGHFEEILTQNDGFDEVRLRLADLLSRRGDHSAAVDQLLELVDERGLLEHRERLALELFRSGRIDECLRRLDELEADGEASVAPLRILALASTGRTEGAAEALAASLASGEDALPQVLATEMSRRQQGAEAVELLDATLDRLPSAFPEETDRDATDRALRLLLAQALLQEERWDRVSTVLDGASEWRTPDGGHAQLARMLLADALVGQGRADEALALLGSDESDDEASAFGFKRAEILHGAGREDESRRELDRLIADEAPDSLFNAASVYQTLELYDEAIPLFERFVEARPDSVAGRFLLGAALERAGRYEEAVSRFKALLEAQPNYHPSLNYLGYMWAERGENLGEALTLLHRAVSLDPANGSYADSLGWVHFKLGELEEALHFLERAASLDPDDPTISEHLGDVYEALGKVEPARRAYQRALDLSQEEPEGGLASLETKLQELGRTHPGGIEPDGLP